MGALDGKTALVTGASSGIGLEAAIKLAAQGAEVVMVARDRKRGETALEAVHRRGSSEKASLLLCDFAVQAEIRRLAEEFRAGHDRLHILVNNAGSVSSDRVVTADGLEQTFAVNHLGPFLLTRLLLDVLERSAPSRIVNVASVGHRGGDMDFDNLQYEKGGYFIMKAYARSKLGNVLFTRELARRLADRRVTVNCLHPGGVATNIWSHAPWYSRPFLAVAQMFMDTPERGGDRIVYLASGPEVEGQTGGYYEDDRLTRPSRRALDDGLARRLWEVSSELVKLPA